MNFGMVMKILWKRHGWEACLFVVISLGISGLIWGDTGFSYLRGLVWLEVGSLFWLVTRVSLTQAGFGTFGGWRAKPVARGWYLLGEAFFLAMPLAIAGTGRVLVAGEISKAEAWGIALLCVFGFAKIIGFGWRLNEGRPKPRWAWGVIATVVIIAIIPTKGWGERHVRGGNTSSMIRPVGEDWQWLRAGSEGGVESDRVGITKGKLLSGETLSLDGWKCDVVEARIVNRRVVLALEGVRVSGLENETPGGIGVLISYGGRYFGVPITHRFKIDRVRVPLLKMEKLSFRAEVLSPLALPENNLAGEELLKGAELWLTFFRGIEAGKREISIPERDRGREWIRLNLAGYHHDDDGEKMREKLRLLGVGAMDDVLGSAPWSESGWEEVVEPYLLNFAREEDFTALRELLKRNPWMGGFFVKKDWGKRVGPILREHLEKGKTLDAESVTYLAELGEEEMGDRLANQLLRMSGDFDEAAKAVRGHPGVDWDAVRREAWRREMSGFGSHHVWVRWGAEMGEKEALRRLLVKASQGRKWELGILRDWFGDEVEGLRKSWERVEFKQGEWVIGE